MANTLQDLLFCVTELRALRTIVVHAHATRDEAERVLIAARRAMNAARDDWYMGRETRDEPLRESRRVLIAADTRRDKCQAALDEALRRQDQWEGVMNTFVHKHVAATAGAELVPSNDPEVSRSVAELVSRLTRDFLTALK